MPLSSAHGWDHHPYYSSTVIPETRCITFATVKSGGNFNGPGRNHVHHPCRGTPRFRTPVSPAFFPSRHSLSQHHPSLAAIFNSMITGAIFFYSFNCSLWAVYPIIDSNIYSLRNITDNKVTSPDWIVIVNLNHNWVPVRTPRFRKERGRIVWAITEISSETSAIMWNLRFGRITAFFRQQTVAKCCSETINWV